MRTRQYALEVGPRGEMRVVSRRPRSLRTVFDVSALVGVLLLGGPLYNNPIPRPSSFGSSWDPVLEVGLGSLIALAWVIAAGLLVPAVVVVTSARLVVNAISPFAVGWRAEPDAPVEVAARAVVDQPDRRRGPEEVVRIIPAEYVTELEEGRDRARQEAKVRERKAKRARAASRAAEVEREEEEEERRESARARRRQSAIERRAAGD